jgi:hypothetical protein
MTDKGEERLWGAQRKGKQLAATAICRDEPQLELLKLLEEKVIEFTVDGRDKIRGSA